MCCGVKTVLNDMGYNVCRPLAEDEGNSPAFEVKKGFLDICMRLSELMLDESTLNHMKENNDISAHCVFVYGNLITFYRIVCSQYCGMSWPKSIVLCCGLIESYSHDSMYVCVCVSFVCHMCVGAFMMQLRSPRRKAAVRHS